jgi:glyoxylase-like metal-dependent hydrolase (beta-lactamase superfamily II)
MTAETNTRPPYLHCISVPTPFPVGPVNLYLADGDPPTLIDTGPRFDPARQALQEGLDAVGMSPSDLGRIIVTHAHSDHCGMAAELAQASGADVLAHPAGFPLLADYGQERARRLAFYAGVMREAGMPLELVLQINRKRRGYGRFARAVQPDAALEEGATVRLGDEDWRVLYTPGHTGDLICLYQPQRRLLLSSDHLLRDVSSNPFVEPPEHKGRRRPRRLLDYVKHLRRVARLPLTLALPGHGPPVTDPRGLIASRLAFHQQRASRILETLSDGPRTVYQITLELFPRLDPMNRFLAVSEVIGHLDLLQARGDVGSTKKGLIRLWRAARGPIRERDATAPRPQ